LTGARTDEVIGTRKAGEWTKLPATWGEIKGDVWVIDGSRMKGKKTHHVPLSPQMVALLGERRADNVPLFKTTSVNALLKTLRKTEAKNTVHGFRTSFSNWVIETTNYGETLADMCIAHLTNSKVRAAYQRSPQLEKRYAIFQEWSEFVAPYRSDQVGRNDQTEEAREPHEHDAAGTGKASRSATPAHIASLIRRARVVGSTNGPFKQLLHCQFDHIFMHCRTIEGDE
jgi:hypothetical protein